MATKKHNQPGCPCCSAPCATTYINVTACCVAASGASVTIKTGGGTTVATCTTSGTGQCTVNLTGYDPSTTALFATIVFDSPYYATFTGQLLGNYCGRSYLFDIPPATDSGSCGTIDVWTFACDGVTPMPSTSVSLYTAAAVLVGTGTTDSSGHYAFTGNAPGNYYVVGTTTLSETLTSSTFTLASSSSEKVTFKFSSTFNIHLPIHCTPPTDAETAETCSGGGVRGCCSSCAPNTLPHTLYITDPCTIFADAGTCACNCTGYTGPIYNPGACNQGWTSTVSISRGGCPPYGYPISQISYTLTCNGTGATLQINGPFQCGSASCSWSGQDGTILTPPTYNSTSFTCSPFAATFSIPAITLNPLGGMTACGTKTVSGRTITVTQ